MPDDKDEEYAYAKLMHDLDTEASDAGMGYGAEAEERPRKRRTQGGSKKKHTIKSDGPPMVMVFVAIVLFVAALQNWYITIPIGILGGFFFGHRAAVVGIILTTITILLIRGGFQEALEAKKAVQNECITTLVSGAAAKHYGKPVDELNILNRSRVNRAVKEATLTLVKKHEEEGIQAVEVFIVEEELVPAHAKREFLDGTRACMDEN